MRTFHFGSRIVRGLFAVLGVVLLAACDTNDGEASDHGHSHDGLAAEAIRVVATTPDLAHLARRVGGSHVEITTIVDGEEDPHVIDVTPGMVTALADAEILLVVGYELEEAWLPDLVAGAKNEAVVEGGPARFVAGDTLRSIEGDTGFRGSVHPENNPHFLVDPIEGIKVAEQLKHRLTELRPTVAGEFEESFAALRDELATLLFGEVIAERLAAGEAEFEQFAIAVESGSEDEVLAGSSQQMDGQIAAFRSLTNNSFVGDHDMWPYFARRYGLYVAGYMEPIPGVEPTTAHLEMLLGEMQTRDVRVILAATYFDPRHARFLADRTNATTVLMAHQVEALPEADTYVAMIQVNAERALEALRAASATSSLQRP
ncbi:MAG: metal ABC transporter substrate-binding protein [Planctomycetota bacterium]